jgi:hypothetical protein
MGPATRTLLLGPALLSLAACGGRTALGDDATGGPAGGAVVDAASLATTDGSGLTPDSGPLACSPGTCATGLALFGGQNGSSAATFGSSAYFDDTWTWDGTSWTQASAVGPSGRCCGEATSAFGAMLLYSGFTDANLTDTWSWSGTSWIELAMGPYPIYGGVMATLGKTVTLYGGDDDWGLPDWETWTWNGTAWNQLTAYNVPSAVNPSVGAPDAVYGCAMASLGDVVVLFGGEDGNNDPNGETWTWDGATWTQLDVAGPSPRVFLSMAPWRGKLLAFGGCSGLAVTCESVLADTWTWDGARWTELNVPGPSARSDYTMATLNGTVVLFGGVDASGNYLADTWTWDGAWTQASVAGPPARSDAVMAAFGGQ